MKKLLETKFSKKLISTLKDQGVKTLFRVENMCAKGTPDLFCSYKKKGWWIELKTEEPLLRPEQYVWARNYAFDCNYCVAVQISEDAIDLYTYPFKVKFDGRFQRIMTDPRLRVDFKSMLLTLNTLL